LRFSWPWAQPIEVLQNLFNFIDKGATKKKKEKDKLVQKKFNHKYLPPLSKPYICLFFCPF
jgi:hypothetical protein